MKHKNKKDDEQIEIDKVTDILDPESKEEEEDIDDTKVSEGMTDDEIVAFCLEELSKGIGGTKSSSSDLDRNVVADEFYFGQRPGLSEASARDPKASTFVSLDVQDAVEATIAEIMPTFNTNEIAFYTPDSEEDEEAAKKESDLVNYMFFHECDGQVILEECLRNSLLKENGTAKVFWDTRKEVTYETYANANAISIMALEQKAFDDDNLTIEFIEQEEQEPDPETGMEQFTVKIKKTELIEKPVIESVKNSRVIVASEHDKPTLYDVRFVAHKNIVTQSDLIEQGFSFEIVDGLKSYYSDIYDLSNSKSNTEFQYTDSDRSVRYIETYECYILLDVDGDGIAERRKVVISDSTLLSNDPWDSVALVGGCVTSIPQRYRGLSLFEKIRGIQESKTPVIRSIIDGTQLSSNPRIGAVKGDANIDDLITSRTGGIVRSETATGVYAIPSAEVPQSSYQYLDLMNNLRRERGGSAIDTVSTAQSMGNSSEGTVQSVMTAMELANAQLSRTFGATLIKGIFIQFHQILRDNYKGEMSANISGQWIKSVPSKWIKRTSVSVSVGVSASERMRQKSAMLEVINYQNQLKQSGSIMYSEEKEYTAIAKAVVLSNIKNPEAYFVDPRSQEGKKAKQSQAKQSQQAQQEQAKLAQQMAKAQQDIADAELMKGQASLQSQQVKFENDQLKNQIAEMKTMLDANAKSIDQELEAEGLRLKDKEIDIKEALELTRMEIDKQKDLSAQNEANKNEGE